MIFLFFHALLSLMQTNQSIFKIIDPYAFSECKHLAKVNIPPNSELQIISKDAFYISSIVNIHMLSIFILHEAISSFILQIIDGYVICNKPIENIIIKQEEWKVPNYKTM